MSENTLGTLKDFRSLLMLSFLEDTSPSFLSNVLEKEGLVCYLGSIVAAFKLLHRKLPKTKTQRQLSSSQYWDHENCCFPLFFPSSREVEYFHPSIIRSHALQVCVCSRPAASFSSPASTLLFLCDLTLF